MIYFDTAYLAKCYLDENGSAAVRSLAASTDRVACCIFGRLELAATLHRSLRESKLSEAEYRLILKQRDFDEADETWTWLPVTAELLASAAAIFRNLPQSIHLRSGDALHLACAIGRGFKEIYTNGRHLLRAASALNITPRNVIS